MTGKLAFTAMAGLTGAALFLAVGIGLAGPDWVNAGGSWIGGQSTCGATTSTRKEVTLPFSADGSFTIALPAAVRYLPGEKAEAVVSGDSTLIDHVRMEGSRLTLDCEPGWFASRLDVSVSGPAISDWKLLGSGDLALSEINQPELRLSIRGSGSVAATGTAQTVDLEISGSGSGRLKNLAAQSAEIKIRGSGDAQITAQADADVSISGSGDVELYGHPTMRRSEVRGSGSITQVP
jgi:carbon monoxide dehydrogenase subunit G